MSLNDTQEKKIEGREHKSLMRERGDKSNFSFAIKENGEKVEDTQIPILPF